MADSKRLLTRKEASRLLKISEQEIQTLTTDKKLTVVNKENSNGVREPFYKTTELEKFRKQQEKSLEKRTKNEAQKNHVHLRTRANNNSNESDQQVERTAISAVEAAAKLILTIEEVSILTHISPMELRNDLKAGKLRGFIKGRGWKIKRADLEDYVRSIYVPKRS